MQSRTERLMKRFGTSYATREEHQSRTSIASQRLQQILEEESEKEAQVIRDEEDPCQEEQQD
jgi:hypothetical protein